jgi:hypothetical protein
LLAGGLLAQRLTRRDEYEYTVARKSIAVAALPLDNDANHKTEPLESPEKAMG